jgi:hypothetical protein
MLAGGASSAAAATITIDFDVDPDGDPIADGAVVDTVYIAYGVTFSAIEGGNPSPVCPVTNVFANASESFASAPNNVSLCDENFGSDFNEGSGLVQGALERAAEEICIAVDPAGGGDRGLLQIVDAGGNELDFVRSAQGVRQTLCIQGSNILFFRFAGDDGDFAIFDDLRITYAPNRIDFDTLADGSEIANGTVVDGLFQSEGVVFEKVGPASDCGAEAVYANDDLPAGFGSPPNAVSVCDGSELSNFSENSMGSVRARFPRNVNQVCIDTVPSPGERGVLRGFDESDVEVAETLAPVGVEARICVTNPSMRAVEFAGYQGGFARFDNLEFTFGAASIDFDEDPSSTPIANGTVINTTYQAAGVVFEGERVGAACGAGDSVYANADATGDFASSPNQVSLCNTAFSDFSENGQGMVHATFPEDALAVCIDVRATQANDYAVLRSFDASDVQLAEETSSDGATETLCISGPAIRGVRFAGDGPRFARFDDLYVLFAPEPGVAALGVAALLVLSGLRRFEGRRRRADAGAPRRT